MTSILFSPYALRDLRLPNRVVVSPMCQYSAIDGDATDWHVMHLGALGQSGAGLVILEATAVNAAGRITPGCLGLWNDRNEAALKRVLDAVRPHASGVYGVQLAHAGRKASSARPWEGGQLLSPAEGGWETVAPSAIGHRADEQPPHALSAGEIEQLIADFVAAAKRALRLDLAAIELHGAHGYLLHEFLSPVSNQRTDDWGGSLANRMRLPLAVYDAVRAVWPADRPLGMRISASDWLEHTGRPSWTIDDSVALANELKQRGCDWVDASSGGISGAQRIPPEPGYQVPFAERIRRETGIATMAVGLITEPAQAESILQAGQADLIAMARALLWNPHWVWHAAARLGGTVTPPVQYNRSAPHGHAAVFKTPPLGTR